MEQTNLSFLQNVLRYSTTHTDPSQQSTEQIEETKVSREMSPERKKWLDTALSQMSINPIDEMKKCLKVLIDENDQDRRAEALETLRDWCEDLNFAIDFHKINGYSLFSDLLNDKNNEIRALTCDLIGTLAQNNPYCQETLISSKILPLLLFKLDKDTEEVKIKAMFSISCLTRDFEPGQQKLLEGNCLDILIKSLSSPIEKLKLKTCFLFSSICQNASIKAQLTQKRSIEVLIDLYRQPESSIHEHILSAINVLIDDNPLAIKQAKEMKFNFKQILTERISHIQEDPSFEVSDLFLISIFLNVLLFKNFINPKGGERHGEENVRKLVSKLNFSIFIFFLILILLIKSKV